MALRRVFGLAVLALLVAGCGGTSSEVRSGAVGRLAPGEVPWILTGPASVLLTNLGGYGAHLELTADRAGNEPDALVLSGELYCRTGGLNFIPEEPRPRSRRGVKPGLSFLWNVSQSSGFVLSEALQAYAPIHAATHPASVALIPAEGSPSQTVSGHHCVEEQVEVVSSNGRTNRFDVWRADDLNGVRLKIVSKSGQQPFTVRLSKVRPGLPSADRFVPPSGFTQYASFDSMLNELDERELAHHPTSPNEAPQFNPNRPDPVRTRRGEPTDY